jgi:hypothetical protein
MTWLWNEVIRKQSEGGAAASHPIGAWMRTLLRVRFDQDAFPGEEA